MGQITIRTKFGVSKTFGVHPLNESASKNTKRKQKKFPEKKPKIHNCKNNSTFMGKRWGIPVYRCNDCKECYIYN